MIFFIGFASVLQPLASPAPKNGLYQVATSEQVSHVQRVAILLPLHTLRRRRRRRRFAGGECGARASQVVLKPHCERVLATKHTSRGPFQILEGRNGLAEIVKRGGGVSVA